MCIGIRTVPLQGPELYRAESKNAETMAQDGHGTPDDWVERNVYSRFTWQGGFDDDHRPRASPAPPVWLCGGADGVDSWPHAAGIINGAGPLPGLL